METKDEVFKALLNEWRMNEIKDKSIVQRQVSYDEIWDSIDNQMKQWLKRFEVAEDEILHLAISHKDYANLELALEQLMKREDLKEHWNSYYATLLKLKENIT